jgi:hypothetical protein
LTDERLVNPQYAFHNLPQQNYYFGFGGNL